MSKERNGYQPTTEETTHNPPSGGSSVMPPEDLSLALDRAINQMTRRLRMDSKRLRELAKWHAEMAALYQQQSEGHRNLMQLSEAAQHRTIACNHRNTAQALTEYAAFKDALDGLTAEDVAAMQTREDAGCAAMSEDGNYDELCRQDKARLLAVAEKLMGVADADT